MRRLLPESAGHPLEAVRMQIPSAPDCLSIGLRLLRDLLRSLDPQTMVYASVTPGADTETVIDLIYRWDCNPERVKFIFSRVECLFSQDNAACVLNSQGEISLLLPLDDNRLGVTESISTEQLGQSYGYPIDRSDLYWDGGNICRDGAHCLIGANTIAQNMDKLEITKEQTLDRFHHAFGYPVSVLGDLDLAISSREEIRSEGVKTGNGGQADFHIDLDVCLLGNIKSNEPPVALLAESEIDFSLLDAILDQEALFDQHFLPPREMQSLYLANLGETMRRRAPFLAQYQATLENLGYQVVKMPDFRLLPELNYLGRINLNFNYLNILTWRSEVNGPACLYASFGISALDQAAEEIFQSCGLHYSSINPVETASANEMMLMRGGLHCAVSKLA